MNAQNGANGAQGRVWPSLADTLMLHCMYEGRCLCDWPFGAPSIHNHITHQMDMWREACTVRTVEELDALPIGTVVMSLPGGIDIGDIYANWTDHYLAHQHGPWFRTGYGIPCPSDEVNLPALLIFHPEWAQS